MEKEQINVDDVLSEMGNKIAALSTENAILNVRLNFYISKYETNEEGE